MTEFVFALDNAIMVWLNGYAGRWPVVDMAVSKFLFLHSVRMLPLAAVCVWIWFSETGRAMRRWMLGEAVMGGALALLITRVIQNVGPERSRPLYDAFLDFQLPIGAVADVPADWSSFPSDTSALAMALAAGIFRASRPWGIVCFLWVALIVCLPRIYVGYHYPSDIIAGAAIGIMATYFVAWLSQLADLPARFAAVKIPQSLSYAFLFVVLFQIITMFDDVRTASRGVVDFLVAGT